MQCRICLRLEPQHQRSPDQRSSRWLSLLPVREPPFFTTGSIVLNLPSATVGEPYNEPEIFDQYTQQYRDDVFWLKGKHSFKMGGEYLYTLHGGAFPQYLRGGLTACTPTAGVPAPNYNTFFPNGTLDPTTWRYDLINAYCGGGETYIQAFGNYNISIGRNIIGVWAQDDWKILPRLTLNLGIRYDNDIGAYNTSYVPTPGLLTPNTNPNLNFGPRLGFCLRSVRQREDLNSWRSWNLLCRPGCQCHHR